MRGRKRHRKKRAKWDRRARARVLDGWFREGRLFIPSRLHLIDSLGYTGDDQADSLALAMSTWKRLVIP